MNDTTEFGLKQGAWKANHHELEPQAFQRMCALRTKWGQYIRKNGKRFLSDDQKHRKAKINAQSHECDTMRDHVRNRYKNRREDGEKAQYSYDECYTLNEDMIDKEDEDEEEEEAEEEEEEDEIHNHNDDGKNNKVSTREMWKLIDMYSLFYPYLLCQKRRGSIEPYAVPFDVHNISSISGEESECTAQERNVSISSPYSSPKFQWVLPVSFWTNPLQAQQNASSAWDGPFNTSQCDPIITELNIWFPHVEGVPFVIDPQTDCVCRVDFRLRYQLWSCSRYVKNLIFSENSPIKERHEDEDEDEDDDSIKNASIPPLHLYILVDASADDLTQKASVVETYLAQTYFPFLSPKSLNIFVVPCTQREELCLWKDHEALTMDLPYNTRKVSQNDDTKAHHKDTFSELICRAHRNNVSGCKSECTTTTTEAPVRPISRDSSEEKKEEEEEEDEEGYGLHLIHFPYSMEARNNAAAPLSSCSYWNCSRKNSPFFLYTRPSTLDFQSAFSSAPSSIKNAYHSDRKICFSPLVSLRQPIGIFHMAYSLYQFPSYLYHQEPACIVEWLQDQLCPVFESCDLPKEDKRLQEFFHHRLSTYVSNLWPKSAHARNRDQKTLLENNSQGKYGTEKKEAEEEEKDNDDHKRSFRIMCLWTLIRWAQTFLDTIACATMVTEKCAFLYPSHLSSFFHHLNKKHNKNNNRVFFPSMFPCGPEKYDMLTKCLRHLLEAPWVYECAFEEVSERSPDLNALFYLWTGYSIVEEHAIQQEKEHEPKHHSPSSTENPNLPTKGDNRGTKKKDQGQKMGSSFSTPWLKRGMSVSTASYVHSLVDRLIVQYFLCTSLPAPSLRTHLNHLEQYLEKILQNEPDKKHCHTRDSSSTCITSSTNAFSPYKPTSSANDNFLETNEGNKITIRMYWLWKLFGVLPSKDIPSHSSSSPSFFLCRAIQNVWKVLYGSVDTSYRRDEKDTIHPLTRTHNHTLSTTLETVASGYTVFQGTEDNNYGKTHCSNPPHTIGQNQGNNSNDHHENDNIPTTPFPCHDKFDYFDELNATANQVYGWIDRLLRFGYPHDERLSVLRKEPTPTPVDQNTSPHPYIKDNETTVYYKISCWPQLCGILYETYCIGLCASCPPATLDQDTTDSPQRRDKTSVVHNASTATNSSSSSSSSSSMSSSSSSSSTHAMRSEERNGSDHDIQLFRWLYQNTWTSHFYHGWCSYFWCASYLFPHHLFLMDRPINKPLHGVLRLGQEVLVRGPLMLCNTNLTKQNRQRNKTRKQRRRTRRTRETK
jgi:hypothetical protein